MKRDYHQTLDSLRSALATTAPDEDDDDLPFPEELFGENGKRAPFEPTGNAKLDAIVRAAAPVFFYGAAPANVWPRDSAKEGVIEEGKRGHITMPHRDQWRSDADYRAVLAHELVHWTKAKGRAERPHAGRTMLDQMFGFVPPGYAREEMVAEIGAALLLDYCGEPQDLKERAGYVNNWGQALNDDDERAKALTWAIGKAEAAVDYLRSLVND